MSVYNQIAQKRTFIGKLDYGSDLLDELTSICQKENIYLGRVEAIGAVQKARLGYYDQKTKNYSFFKIDQNLEIASLLGNISMCDGKPMVHAHVTFSDKDSNAYGEAFELRNVSDYEMLGSIEREQALAVIKNAKQFVNQCDAYFKEKGKTTP